MKKFIATKDIFWISMSTVISKGEVGKEFTKTVPTGFFSKSEVSFVGFPCGINLPLSMVERARDSFRRIPVKEDI